LDAGLRLLHLRHYGRGGGHRTLNRPFRRFRPRLDYEVSMTEDEKDRLRANLAVLRGVMIVVDDEATLNANEERIYQLFKELHTAALAPFCTLCKIWEERRGLNPTKRSLTDAINLEELFTSDSGGASPSGDLET
jgi:hypothetical protein